MLVLVRKALKSCRPNSVRLEGGAGLAQTIRQGFRLGAAAFPIGMMQPSDPSSAEPVA